MRNQRVSSYSPVRCKYDVFLNFQSEDTGKNFTDHLYAALDRKGFKVFKCDDEFEREIPISNRIEDSRISIVVFSKSYASSIRCLDELVKIVKCKNTMEQIVIPVFYGVEPYEPRHQEGVFKEAFSGHEESFEEDIEKVQMWRKSLKEVSDLSGFHLKDGYEAEFIEGVVKEISSKLTSSTSTSTSTSTSASTSSSASNFINATGVITFLENLVMQVHTIRVVGPISQYLTPHPPPPPLFFFNFFF